LALAFGFLFLPFCFKRFLLGIFFFSSRKKKHTHTHTHTHTHKEKKTIEKKKNAKKGRSLLFSLASNEAFFLLSPLHIPSTLKSPPFSSLVSPVSSKLYATQVQELS
jgi:hypothetical protein